MLLCIIMIVHHACRQPHAPAAARAVEEEEASRITDTTIIDHDHRSSTRPSAHHHLLIIHRSQSSLIITHIDDVIRRTARGRTVQKCVGWSGAGNASRELYVSLLERPPPTRKSEEACSTTDTVPPNPR